jgi:purine catabolism regulator
LLEYDRGHRRKLLPTLEALAAHDGRKAATARALNMNRQALYARIERIEEIIGCDLSAGGTIAAIDLAIRAHRHLRSHSD